MLSPASPELAATPYRSYDGEMQIMSRLCVVKTISPCPAGPEG